MYIENMKALNRLANQVYAANSVGQIASFPEMLTVAVSNVCNYRCIMCAEWRKPKNQDLSPALIEKLEDALPFISTLYLTGGEPLIYPHLDQLLDAGARAGCNLQMVTNGALLTPKRLEKLFKHGMDKIKFSLDAVRPATYKKIRGGDLNAVLQNMKNLVEVKRALGVDHPFVEIGFVAMRSNIAELSKFVVMARKLGVDSIYVAYMAVHHPDVYEESLYHDQERSDELMLTAAQVAKEVGMPLTLPPLFRQDEKAEGLGNFRTGRGLCHEPWHSMFLWPDGNVSMCCGGGEPCGNLAEHTFPEMWNHPARVKARTRVNTPNPPKACARCFTKRQNPNRLETHFTDPTQQKRAREERRAEAEPVAEAC